MIGVLLAFGAVAVVALLSKRSSMSQGPGQSPSGFNLGHYPPHQPMTEALFHAASRLAGTPSEWATRLSLHELLAAESGGWVGIPNYHFGNFWGGKRQEVWPILWDAIKKGHWQNYLAEPFLSYAQGTKPPPADWAGPSSATGLGQLTASNIPKYYPSKLNGIGHALDEAAGMLKYILDRYRDPDAAWSFHQTHGWY